MYLKNIISGTYGEQTHSWDDILQEEGIYMPVDDFRARIIVVYSPAATSCPNVLLLDLIEQALFAADPLAWADTKFVKTNEEISLHLE